MEARADRPVWHAEDVCDLAERQAHIVVKHDDGAMVGRQAIERADDPVAEVGVRERIRAPRLFLIESEYQLALRRAETEWVRGLLTEFTDGTFPGLEDWQRFHDTGELPADIQALAQTERGEAAGS